MIAKPYRKDDGESRILRVSQGLLDVDAARINDPGRDRAELLSRRESSGDGSRSPANLQHTPLEAHRFPRQH